MSGDKASKKGGKKNRKYGREARVHRYERWVKRGGLKRKAAQILKSCGETFVTAWGQAQELQGTVQTVINQRRERLATKK